MQVAVVAVVAGKVSEVGIESGCGAVPGAAIDKRLRAFFVNMPQGG